MHNLYMNLKYIEIHHVIEMLIINDYSSRHPNEAVRPLVLLNNNSSDDVCYAIEVIFIMLQIFYCASSDHL